VPKQLLLLRVTSSAICIRLHAYTDTTAFDPCHLDHFREPKDVFGFRTEQIRIVAQGIRRYVQSSAFGFVRARIVGHNRSNCWTEKYPHNFRRVEIRRVHGFFGRGCVGIAVIGSRGTVGFTIPSIACVAVVLLVTPAKFLLMFGRPGNGHLPPCIATGERAAPHFISRGMRGYM
jgi:hypothetical protein